MLFFLRTKYQLFDLNDDPFLSPKLLKSSNRQLSKLKRSPATHYVIVINPKCAISPHISDTYSSHPLSKEWELIRRIVIEVGKPADNKEENKVDPA